MTLDRKVVVVGNSEVKIMIEDGKCRLIHAKYILKLVEYDLEADDDTP
jgi:hypothetical protein